MEDAWEWACQGSCLHSAGPGQALGSLFLQCNHRTAKELPPCPDSRSPWVRSCLPFCLSGAGRTSSTNFFLTEVTLDSQTAGDNHLSANQPWWPGPVAAVRKHPWLSTPPATTRASSSSRCHSPQRNYHPEGKI